MNVLVWFRNDLRVSDHAPLARAAESGAVLPLYVADPADWAGPCAAGRHWRFVAATLSELREDLAGLGAALALRQGAAHEVIPRLCRTRRITHLFSHRRPAGDGTDLRLRAALQEAGVTWQEFDEESGPPPARLQAVEGAETGLIPPARSLGLAEDPCAHAQCGGRSAGLAMLQSYVKTRGLKGYVNPASPISGERSSARLSPWLTHGALSRFEVSAALADTALPAAAQRSLTSRLAQRRRAHSHPICLPAAQGEAPALAAFAEGRSGLPFADACLRALRASGWINANGRTLIASVALHHLRADLAATGQMLARLLTDYDPAIFWPQLRAVQAGRVIDPVRAGEEHDPQGRFIRRWLPELAAVPEGYLHRPWRWSGAGSVLGRRYPEPLADPALALRAARELRRSFSRDEAFEVIEDPLQRFWTAVQPPSAQLRLDL